jgi:hypothetical protein
MNTHSDKFILFVVIGTIGELKLVPRGLLANPCMHHIALLIYILSFTQLGPMYNPIKLMFLEILLVDHMVHNAYGLKQSIQWDRYTLQWKKICIVTLFAFKSMFVNVDPMGFVILDGFGCWSYMQAK